MDFGLSPDQKDCLLLHGHYGYAEEFGLEQPCLRPVRQAPSRRPARVTGAG